MKIVAKGNKGKNITEVTLDASGFNNETDFDFKVGMSLTGYDEEVLNFKVKGLPSVYSIEPKEATASIEEVKGNWYGESNAIFTIKGYKGKKPKITLTSTSTDTDIKIIITKVQSVTVYDKNTNFITLGLKGINLGSVTEDNIPIVINVDLDDGNGNKERHKVTLKLVKRLIKRTLIPCYYSSPIAGYELGIVYNNPNNLAPGVDYDNSSCHLVLSSFIKDNTLPAHYPVNTDVYIGLMPGTGVLQQDPVLTCNNPDVTISNVNIVDLNPDGNGFDTVKQGQVTPKGKVIDLLKELSNGNVGAIEPMNVRLTYWVVKTNQPHKDVVFTITNPENNETTELHIDFDLPSVIVTSNTTTNVLPNNNIMEDYVNEVDIQKVAWPLEQYHLDYKKLNIDTELLSNNPCIFPRPEKPNKSERGYYYWNMYPSTYTDRKIVIGSPADYLSSYAINLTDMRYQCKLCLNELDSTQESFVLVRPGKYFNKNGNIFRSDYRYSLEADSSIIEPAKVISSVDRLEYDGEDFEVIVQHRPYEFTCVVNNDVTQKLSGLNGNFYVGDVLEVIFKGYTELGTGKSLFKPGHPSVTSVMVKYGNKTSYYLTKVTKRTEPELEGAYSVILPKLIKPGILTMVTTLSRDVSKTGQFYKNASRFQIEVKPSRPDIKTDLDTYVFDK